MGEPSEEEKRYYHLEEQLGTIQNARLSLLRDRNNWLSLDIALVEGTDGPGCSFFTVGWNILCDNNDHNFAETLYNIFNETRVEDVKEIIGRRVKIYYENGCILYGFSFFNWKVSDTKLNDLEDRICEFKSKVYQECDKFIEEIKQIREE
jgi:hypothetical protein